MVYDRYLIFGCLDREGAGTERALRDTNMLQSFAFNLVACPTVGLRA